MKTIYSMVCLVILMTGCQPKAENQTSVADDAFKKNAETVRQDIENWENETPDYSLYADDFYTFSTMFGGSSDTVRLEQMKEEDKQTLAMLDFELVSEYNPLPGVSVETKKPDGSVRYYGDWKVTKPATDSTDQKSGVMSFYGTYDFNKEGKIVTALGYGDFSGLMMYLNSDSTSAE